MGSRSRVTTLADVKEKEDEKLILSSAPTLLIISMTVIDEEYGTGQLILQV